MTQDELKKLLRYDQETGSFAWKVATNKRISVGQIAGTVNQEGYVNIGVLRKRYLAHRLAWLYVNGEMPDGEIDHINRIRSDNRISNLRAVSRKQNCENLGVRSDNTTGFRGVRKDNRPGKSPFVARVVNHGKDIYIGSFQTAEEASNAYLKKATELFTCIV
jgi:hypothetical protein